MIQVSKALNGIGKSAYHYDITNIVFIQYDNYPGGSLSHISATHLCTHTSKLAPKWRNAHHQILHPYYGVIHEKPFLKHVKAYRIVSNKHSPSNKRPPNLFSNKTR